MICSWAKLLLSLEGKIVCIFYKYLYDKVCKKVIRTLSIAMSAIGVKYIADEYYYYILECKKYLPKKYYCRSNV